MRAPQSGPAAMSAAARTALWGRGNGGGDRTETETAEQPFQQGRGSGGRPPRASRREAARTALRHAAAASPIPANPTEQTEIPFQLKGPRPTASGESFPRSFAEIKPPHKLASKHLLCELTAVAVDERPVAAALTQKLL